MYVGGESYAGQYVPYIGLGFLWLFDYVMYISAANAILESNLRVNLMGAAIGNGWIDGRSQYPAYLEYAVKHGLVEESSDVSMRCIFIYF